ncbi:conserved protein of unknown function [Shewanella benthica]|uniref:Uncharacterized protein n=1 Tax=Shewanella benthica TaxID=43661 RepID=A0A330M157_9GAMM|nr:conserved protein of unknown function [Shewanella benthica]
MLIKLKLTALTEIIAETRDSLVTLEATPCSGNSKQADVSKANMKLEANFIEYVRCLNAFICYQCKYPILKTQVLKSQSLKSKP